MAKNTPNKHKSQKNESKSPKKQQNTATPKKVVKDGVTKAKNAPNLKSRLFPEHLFKTYNKAQRKRIVRKLLKTLKKGTDDIKNVDPNDASVKEFFDKLETKTNISQKINEEVDVKNEVDVKEEIDAKEEVDEKIIVKTPKKKKSPKKSPK